MAAHELADADVASVWQGLGLPGLADIHVHFLPEAMLAKVWSYFDEAERHYGMAWPVTYRTSDVERIATLTALGVRRFPTLAYPHKPGMAAWLNDWCDDFADRHPQAIRSATFYAEPEAPDYVRTALDRGARVFKVHLQVGDFDPTDRLIDKVWGMLSDARVPVVIHCGSGPLPGRHTGPGPIGEVLARHPQLTAVIAHAGAPEYREHLALAERYPHTRLDTTMIGTPFMQRFAPIPVDVLDRYRALPHKIVLGTDFPNIPYSYACQIQSLLDWQFGDDWLRQVLWFNGAGLMGLL